MFHTIDCRLYELGFEKVKKRRYVMLQFLQYAKQTTAQATTYMKFGHGNLTKTLDQFFAQNEQFTHLRGGNIHVHFNY